ncbi:MAG: universal stress protein [Rubrobacter sp.]
MSIFPAKILLSTDGSEDAELAARTAIGLAGGTGSELRVVHVGLAIPEGLPPYIPEWSDPTRSKREARELLDDQMNKITAAGGEGARAHLRTGEAEEIVALGEEIAAGLIVVGSRGRGQLRRALMGSVSDSVVRHAHCPVLVVRGEGDGEPVFTSKKILLATDGSEEAQLALQVAVDLANATGSELHVAHIGRLLSYIGGVGPTVGPLPGSQDELDRKAREVLDGQVQRAKAAGGVVTQAHLGRASFPDADIVVLGEEIGAGLIVLGSRGTGGVRRALVGCVADSVVRHAHCPVLVVRAQDTSNRPREEGEEKPTFWDTLFGPYPSGREEKVLSYVIHRVGEGAHLRDVTQEEYVRRNASPDEVEQILDNPRLIEAARKKMGEDFRSMRLDPNRQGASRR